MKILGIDIGGTNIKYTVYDVDFKNREFETISTPANGPKIVETVIELIKKTKAELVGISTAGAVKFETGEIFSSPNIANYEGTQWKRLIKEATNVPAYIDNDVNCAAYAEYKKGSLQGTTNSIMLTIGTGIGSGIIINKQLYRGSNYAAGEIGFQLINGEFYEKIASTLSVIKKSSQLGIMSGFSLLDENNPKAVEIVNEWYKNLATGIINVVSALDVEKVCLGGGVVSNQAFKIEEILNWVMELGIIKTTNPNLQIVKAAFENQAGSLGSALMAYDKYLEDSK